MPTTFMEKISGLNGHAVVAGDASPIEEGMGGAEFRVAMRPGHRPRLVRY